MAEELTPDICVIGGGPGGIAVATGAAALGVPVVLVEKAAMGGANLAYGGVPAAALATAANHYEYLRRGPAIGVTGAPLQVNFGKIHDHIRAVVDRVAANLSAERLTGLGIRVIHAAASFTDRRTVTAGEATIRARRFVIATGAVPLAPPIAGLDGVEAIGLAEALDLGRKPAHLLVLGAGPRGLELAQAYARLGVDATVVDSERPLAEADAELVQLVLDRLAADGVRVRAPVKIANIARRRGGIRVTLAGGGDEVPIDGSHLLVAAGRRPAIDSLGLDQAGIVHDREGITVDRTLRTTNRRVYALGDAVAGPALVNRAEYQAGRVLAAILYRLPVRDFPERVPAVTFTDPALASVGLGEDEARRRDPTIRVLRFPFAENDRAAAERMSAGMIKVITTRRGRILGAAAVGHEAGETIALWSMALGRRMNIAAMAGLVPAYPSRAAISARVAAGFVTPATLPHWHRRVIEFLRRFG